MDLCSMLCGQLYSGAWWASIYGVTQSRTRLKRLSSSSSIVGLMTTSSKRSYGTCRTASPRAPAPESGHCWPGPPQETLKHSKAGLTQSLWGLLVHTRFCLSPPSISVGMGFDSRHDFSPPTILLGLLLCAWMWDIFFWWDPTFSCQWLFSGKL